MENDGAFALLNTRNQRADGFAYKLNGSQYAMDYAVQDQLDIDEKRMSVWIPFADGNRRDGVGDLLEVGGIQTERHQRNPIVLFDHGKQVTLPIALAEDRDTRTYTVHIDPVGRKAKANAFFYQGKGISGVTSGEEYDHALFCEQLFDMMVKGYIRSGSIGYQVVAARELQPDYEKGTPKGLHLLAVNMLECSAVVMPANMDTVRKMLDLPHCCGKPLSPMLIKSLTPYVPERKVQMGYEKKDCVCADQQSKSQKASESYIPVFSSDNPAQQAMTLSNFRDYARERSEQVKKTRGSSATSKPPTQQPAKQSAQSSSQPAIRHGTRQAARLDKTLPSEKIDPKKGSSQPAQQQPEQSSSRPAQQQPEQSSSQPAIRYGTRQAARIHNSPSTIRYGTRQAARLDKTLPSEKIDPKKARRISIRKKTEPIARTRQGLVPGESSKDLRYRYRHSVKGVLHRLKKSSPGSAIIYVSSKDLYSVESDAKTKGLGFRHLGTVGKNIEKIKLIGDDSAIDSVAKSYGRLVRFASGRKSLEIDHMIKEEKAMDPTNAETDVVHTSISDPSGEEPLGAQILRRLHDDHSLLMQEYDSMLGLLENESVRKRLIRKLEDLESELTEYEDLFTKIYPDLPGLIDTKDMTEDEAEEIAEVTDDIAEDLEDVSEEVEEQAEDVEPEEEFVGGEEEVPEEAGEVEDPKDMDTMDDQGIPNDSGHPDDPSPEDVLEGMERETKSIKTGTTWRGAVQPMASRRDLTKLKSLCPKCKRAGKRVCACGQKFAPIAAALGGGGAGAMLGRIATQAAVGAATDKMQKKLSDRDKMLITEGRDFLGKLSEEGSILDEEGRMSSFHFAKSFDGIAQFYQINEELNEGEVEGDIPTAEWDPGVGAIEGEKSAKPELRFGKTPKRTTENITWGETETPPGRRADPARGSAVLYSPRGGTHHYGARGRQAGPTGEIILARQSSDPQMISKFPDLYDERGDVPLEDQRKSVAGNTSGEEPSKLPSKIISKWRSRDPSQMVQIRPGQTVARSPIRQTPWQQLFQRKIKTLGEAAALFKELSWTKDFGDPHRKMCKDMYSALEPVLKEDDVVDGEGMDPVMDEEEGLDTREQLAEGIEQVAEEEEIPGIITEEDLEESGEIDHKSLSQTFEQQNKEMEDLLAKLTAIPL